MGDINGHVDCIKALAFEDAALFHVGSKGHSAMEDARPAGKESSAPKIDEMMAAIATRLKPKSILSGFGDAESLPSGMKSPRI